MTSIKRRIYIFLFIPIFIFSFISLCHNVSKKNNDIDRTRKIELNTELIIGLEMESSDHIFGEPIAVRTDKKGNIYIADRASLTVKVFDSKGNYLKSLGRRGRGPAEFHDMNLMEITPDSNLFFLDRGNLRFTTITFDGKHIATQPIEISNQFYPTKLAYLDDEIIGLYLSADIPSRSPVYDRELFHIYSPCFENTLKSFAPFNILGIEDMFGWNQLSLYNGSFLINYGKLIYSPGIYNGTFYVFSQNQDVWELESTIQGIPPHDKPYLNFETEDEYKRAEDYPGSLKIFYGYGPYRGKLNSMDAGFFQLSNESYIHFFAEWRGGNQSLEDGNLLDLSVQIFNEKGELKDHSYLLSMKYNNRPKYTFVNWKDEHDNFYLLDYSEGIPTVRRFSLNWNH